MDAMLRDACRASSGFFTGGIQVRAAKVLVDTGGPDL
jgi:hypothetical protein